MPSRPDTSRLYVRKKSRWVWPSVLAGAALIVIIVALAFLYGPLFPWSPVKPGYTHFILHRADVFYPTGTILEEPYQQVDAMIAEAETFFRLKMPDRITVIAPNTWTKFHMEAPWDRGPVAGLTLQMGTVIFITPKVAEKHADPAEYLRHEIGHAILDQNMTLWRGHKLSQQQWLFEGLAVDFGRQKSYLSEEEFVARARTEPLAPSFHGDHSDMRFTYVAWRYFLEHMIHTRGRDRFQDYLLRVMAEPDRARELFPEYFSISFDAAVLEFQGRVREPGGIGSL